MALESVFKLSLVMNLVDNLSSPLGKIQDQTEKTMTGFQKFDAHMSNLAKSGAAMSSLGGQMTRSGMEIVTSSFDAQLALGELSSLGIKDLNVLSDTATDFSNTWANTTRAEFLGAAYDIKSGIASLNDEGVAQYTNLAGLTAKATKATTAEMTSLFATGYGIYKDYYSQMSDLEFGEMFSSGISKSVQQFKTTGSGMAQAISSLGGSATTAMIPLEEQLTILGMLQATMSSQEAGTKYKAFIRSAVKGGQELGLSFMDANNQMLPMNVILDQLRGRFGETMDAAEKMELQKAFGDTESVALIDLLYSKTGDLATNIDAVSQAMAGGTTQTLNMANAINNVTPSKYDLVSQKIQNVKETISTSMLPTIDKMLDKVNGLVDKVSGWVQENEGLASSIMIGVIAVGILASVIGSTMVIFGAFGLVISKLGQGTISFINTIKNLPTTLNNLAITLGDLKNEMVRALIGVKNLGLQFLSFAKSSAVSAFTAVKSFTLGLVGMAKQAIITGATALPGLISSTWTWTAALLANPVVWVTLGIMALLAAILILADNWDAVSQWISSAWNSACAGVQGGIDWIIGGFQSMLNWFASLPSMFYESGKKIISTFVDGVKSMASAPFNAVKSIFGKVRELLPFSDAHEGPFSKLTLSGQRVITTLTKGIYEEENEPAKAVEKSFSKVSLVQEEKKTVSRKFFNHDADESEQSTVGKKSEGTTIKIGKMELHVDLKEIEDIKKLRMLLEQLQEITDGSDPLPEGA